MNATEIGGEPDKGAPLEWHAPILSDADDDGDERVGREDAAWAASAGRLLLLREYGGLHRRDQDRQKENAKGCAPGGSGIHMRLRKRKDGSRQTVPASENNNFAKHTGQYEDPRFLT